MNNLIEIQTQIEILQKQASEIKTREFDKTVQDILAKMQAFGITLKDLQPPKTRGAKGKGKTAKVAGTPKVKREGATPKVKSTTPVAAKFRGPNGESWSGRGLTPRWLAALVAQGQSKEAFSVQP